MVQPHELQRWSLINIPGKKKIKENQNTKETYSPLTKSNSLPHLLVILFVEDRIWERFVERSSHMYRWIYTRYQF